MRFAMSIATTIGWCAASSTGSIQGTGIRFLEDFPAEWTGSRKIRFEIYDSNESNGPFDVDLFWTNVEDYGNSAGEEKRIWSGHGVAAGPFEISLAPSFDVGGRHFVVKMNDRRGNESVDRKNDRESIERVVATMLYVGCATVLATSFFLLSASDIASLLPVWASS